MLLKAFGKFVSGFFILLVGLVLLSFMCRGETCGQAIFSLVSEVSEEEKNIIIEVPDNNEVIKNPFIVRGKARVFEGTVNYELRDVRGELLAEGFFTTQAGGVSDFRMFAGSISYSTPTAPAGKLKMFDFSPKDGERMDQTSVNVAFISAEYE